MFQRNKKAEFGDSVNFNNFKYGILPHLLRLGFKLIEERNEWDPKYSINQVYSKEVNDINYTIVLFGDYRRVLDEKETDKFCISVGCSNDIQFVPMFYSFFIETRVYCTVLSGRAKTEKVKYVIDVNEETIFDFDREQLTSFIDEKFNELENELHLSYPLDSFNYTLDYHDRYIKLRNTKIDYSLDGELKYECNF